MTDSELEELLYELQQLLNSISDGRDSRHVGGSISGRAARSDGDAARDPATKGTPIDDSPGTDDGQDKTTDTDTSSAGSAGTGQDPHAQIRQAQWAVADALENEYTLDDFVDGDLVSDASESDQDSSDTSESMSRVSKTKRVRHEDGSFPDGGLPAVQVNETVSDCICEIVVDSGDPTASVELDGRQLRLEFTHYPITDVFELDVDSPMIEREQKYDMTRFVILEGDG